MELLSDGNYSIHSKNFKTSIKRKHLYHLALLLHPAVIRMMNQKIKMKNLKLKNKFKMLNPLESKFILYNRQVKSKVIVK